MVSKTATPNELVTAHIGPFLAGLRTAAILAPIKWGGQDRLGGASENCV